MGSRVFVVGGREIIGPGVVELVILESDQDVRDEAATMEAALASELARCLDVMVLEVTTFDHGDVEQGRSPQHKPPEPRCVMVTSSADRNAVLDAILAGCAGSVLQEMLARLVAATGDEAAPHQVDHDRSQRLRRLTEQERLVLDHIAGGLTNREIAERMHLKEKTIKNYVSQVLAKLGMKRRTQAAIFATELRRA